jgi:predicted MFS family arabinose efflux permease
MGLWGGFVPAGVTLIMLIAAAGLAQLDWRGLWQVGAALILLAAAALHWGWREHAAQPGQRGASEPLRIAFQRGPLLLAACFACYSAQFLGVVSFLPGVLQQQAGLSPTSASVIVALAVSLNILGNLASGWLMQHGLRPRQLLTIGALATLLSSIPLFAAEGMLPVQIACACLFTGLSGLIPGAAFAAVPAYAERPSQLPIFNGMLMQGVGIGQTIGPLLLAGVVEMLGGWQWAWVSIAIFSVFALTATAALPKAN